MLEGKDWEVIFVDDGSKDGSWRVVEQLHRQETRFKGIRFRRNYGKSAALSQGFGMAQEMWSLPWMLIFRTARMKYLN